jgi:molybdate transport system regulatory protein
MQLSEILGHDVADRRIDLLRHIDEAGSISEAARRSGVSYKAAWQAIETLNNLAGTRLVDKAVGGSGGGGAALTTAGRQVVAAASRLAIARWAILAELNEAPSPVHPGLQMAVTSLRTSMRNQLPARISEVENLGSTVRVWMTVADGARLPSRITPESGEILGLRPGLEVLALFKATAVQLIPLTPESPSAQGLTGKIVQISDAQPTSEAVLAVGDSARIIGFSHPMHALTLDQTAAALVDETSVVIALS